jgi:hypothetical protein
MGLIEVTKKEGESFLAFPFAKVQEEDRLCDYKSVM